MDLNKFFDDLAALRTSLENLPPVFMDIDWGSACTDTGNDLPRITVCDGDNVVYPPTPACWDSPNVALGGVLIKPDEQCFILCTPSAKERILHLAESKWDKCPFTDGCQEFYGYDCRKCLEHRIKWKLTD